MIAAALLLLAGPPQTVEYQAAPAREYVLRGTVRAPGPVHVPGRPSDCRLVLELEGDDVYEVAALQAPGDGDFAVAPGAPSRASALRIDLLGRPNLLGLRVNGGAVYPLTDSAAFTGWHRRPGACLATASYHRQLGPHGWATYWITLRADARQMDVALLLHQAIPGPNVPVQSVEVVSPLHWRPSLPDPAYQVPGWLVKPGAYSIPQQRGRIFRFSVGPDAEPERVGTSDSWYSGGYGPGGLPLPRVSLPGFAQELASARAGLRALQPVNPWEPPPQSALWPASGEASADGHTHDIQPLYGSRWAVSRGDPAALELFQIEQLRAQARASIRLGPDGRQLQLDAYPRLWRYHDGFLQGQDAPWEWDRWAPPAWLPFADFGIKSYVARLNESWALVWLANDPVARLLALEGATRARLTWDDFPPPPAPFLGTEFGQGEASGALAVFVARALGDHQHDRWADTFVAHLRQAQMISGCLVARRGAYPSQHAPYSSDDYALQGDLEFALLMLAAYSLGAHDVAERCAAGMVGLATDWDDPGLYYFTVTGRGPADRYLWQSQWPASLYAQMGVDGSITYYTAWSAGYPIALAVATGSPNAPELLTRWGANSVDMRAWGLTAPDSHTRAPFDQWAPLLGVLP